MFPRITVSGDARERGRQYGELARPQVLRSISAYQDVFAHFAGWDWNRVRAEAAAFAAPIEAYGPKYLEEIRGIAEGAGVDEHDILAINVRTEVMFAASARAAATTGEAKPLPPECSSFALMSNRAVEGRILIGQNWDWLSHAAETTIVLEARQSDAPDYVTVVEAGLLAKFGMNSSGVGLVTNALVSGEDQGLPGVPMHVLLRATLDCETISDALKGLLRARRAASANYVLAHADGVVIDVEAGAGDVSQVWLGYPEDGVLLHTNHFINPGFDAREVSLFAMPDSPFRLQRLRELVREREGTKLDRAFFVTALTDHATFPLGVCCHRDPRLSAPEEWETLASAVMDLAERRLWLASGQPCVAPFDELDYSELLSKPSITVAPA